MKNLWVLYCLFLIGVVLPAFEDACAQSTMGINNPGRNAMMPVCFPLNKDDLVKVSSAYGYRKHPVHKKICMHEGIDLVAKKGKPIYATANGIVQSAGYEKGYGNRLVIMHLPGMKSLYAHLWITMVKKGEKVLQGQLIGLVGDTGLVTGPHLHYEIWLRNKKVDPVLVWKNLLKEEAKASAVDE